MKKSEIVFGKPDLYHPTRTRKALRGVAFFNDNVVGFELEVSAYVRLMIEAVAAGWHIYNFFNKIFEKYGRSDVERYEGLYKSLGGLVMDWWIDEKSWDDILKEIKQKMGEEWYSAFRELLRC